jgi:uncharacterized protein YjcR
MTFGPECLAALGFAADDDEMPSTEVATMLGVSRVSVAVWIRTGQLSAQKASNFRAGQGGLYLIRVADLKAFVAARSVQS